MNEENLVDIFEPSEEYYEGNLVKIGFRSRPHFVREATFEEDILSLLKKWKGHKNEVLIHHMRDSLKVFLHNKREYDIYFGTKS